MHGMVVNICGMTFYLIVIGFWSTETTGWPVIHGRVFLVPCKTWLSLFTLLHSDVRHFLQRTRTTRPCLSGRIALSRNVHVWCSGVSKRYNKMVSTTALHILLFFESGLLYLAVRDYLSRGICKWKNLLFFIFCYFILLVSSFYGILSFHGKYMEKQTLKTSYFYF